MPKRRGSWLTSNSLPVLKLATTVRTNAITAQVPVCTKTTSGILHVASRWTSTVRKSAGWLQAIWQETVSRRRLFVVCALKCAMPVEKSAIGTGRWSTAGAAPKPAVGALRNAARWLDSSRAPLACQKPALTERRPATSSFPPAEVLPSVKTERPTVRAALADQALVVPVACRSATTQYRRDGYRGRGKDQKRENAHG